MVRFVLALPSVGLSPLVLFFFQAEDGIRGTSVTGVQTCALPISSGAPPTSRCPPCRRSPSPPTCRRRQCCRSEERRVGKECTSRWSRGDLTRKRRLASCCPQQAKRVSDLPFRVHSTSTPRPAERG